MRVLHLFRSDRRGVSAIEFALLAPLFALLLVGILSIWMRAAHLGDMHHAVGVGANYFIQGGSDSQAATELALEAWTKRGDGSLLITRECYCGEAANECTTVCMPGATAPNMFMTVAARKTFEPPLFKLFFATDLNLQHQKTVRVR